MLSLYYICIMVFILALCPKCRTRASNIGTRCKEQCQSVPCRYGCQLWPSALHYTCQHQCEDKQFSQQEAQLCQFGCGTAVDMYVADVSRLLDKHWGGLLLVAGSRTNVSLMLRCDSIASFPNLTFLLQLRKALLSDDWRYHDDTQWMPPDILMVSSLHPYVTYQFRLMVVLGGKHTIILPNSLPIITKPYGVPSNAPRLLHVSAGMTSVHVKWLPPILTNDRLVSYKLTVASSDDSRSRDVIVAGDDRLPISEVVTLLQPHTTYELTVVAVNRFGSGPGAQRKVTTKQKMKADSENTYLILGAENTLLKQHLADVFSTSEVLYESEKKENVITGVAVHYSRGEVFFSQANGSVCLLNINVASEAKCIYHSTAHPTILSVDWLHNLLYVVEDEMIRQCHLDGTVCTTVIFDLDPKPDDLVVDACNGYLFWTQVGTGHGLYRVDLADLPDPNPQLIVSSDLISSFTVDFLGYRVLFANQTSNTMISADLAGDDPIDIRPNTHNPDFIHVRSIVYTNALFYWSIGSKVVMEEYDPLAGRYYHNEMLFLHSDFVGLNVWHQSAQPTPVALSAPTDVQSLMTSDSALVSWSAPELDQGKGAWHDWSYEVSMSMDGVAMEMTHTDASQVSLSHLNAQSRYGFKVRAVTVGGQGPWSATFDTTTLRAAAECAHLIYADDGAIYWTELDGCSHQLIVNLSSSLSDVKDILDWNDLLIWSLSNGIVYVKAEGQPIKSLVSVQDAATLAVDWLTGTLYWASSRHNMIQRVMLPADSEVRGELLHQGVAVVQGLVVDALYGFLYWSTVQTVEVAHLDGHRHHIVYTLPFFSGHYVLGIALSYEHNALFWLTKIADKLVLHQMTLVLDADDAMPHHVTHAISIASATVTAAGIRYYSGKLFWQSGPQHITVLDIETESVARMLVAPSSMLKAFTISHSSLYQLTDGMIQASIIPHTINVESIQLSGAWDDFNITWSPVLVERASVYYVVQIRIKDTQRIQERNEAYVTLRDISPYSDVQLTLKACTRWGCSDAVQSTVKTPMAAPSAPDDPRVFITHHPHTRLTASGHVVHSMSVSVSLRWRPPVQPNGDISVYHVYVAGHVAGPWNVTTLPASHHGHDL